MFNKLYDKASAEEVCVNCKNKKTNNICGLDNHSITQKECFEKCRKFEIREDLEKELNE